MTRKPRKELPKIDRDQQVSTLNALRDLENDPGWQVMKAHMVEVRETARRTLEVTPLAGRGAYDAAVAQGVVQAINGALDYPESMVKRIVSRLAETPG